MAERAGLSRRLAEDPFVWRSARGYHLLLHSLGGGGGQAVGGVAFSKDGKRVAASSLDNKVSVWDLPASGARTKARPKSKARAKTKSGR